MKLAAPSSPDASGMCTQGAWANGAFGQGTVIAILDSGIDDRNDDLQNQMVTEANNPEFADPDFPGADHGWNFYDDNGETMDFYGHGTGRAGIAAAEADNGIQMAGVSPKSKLLAVKVGDTYVVSGENAAQGIVYAADHGADAINTSLGVTANSRLLRMAAVYADSKGVFFAAATANEYSNHHNYPTNLDTVSGATGLGPDDALVQAQTCQSYAPPSNCTPATPQKTFLQKVNYANFGGIADFATPIDTPSTGRGDPGSSGPHASGTSTAAPHLAGAATVVRSAGFLAGMCDGQPNIDGVLTGATCDQPRLSANELRQLLAYTATRIHNDDAPDNNYPPNPSGDPTLAGGEYYPQQGGDPNLAWNQWSGFGRPDLFAATAYARAGLVPPEVQLYGDTPPPTPAFEGLAGPVPYAVLTPELTPTVDIVGHVGSPRIDESTLEWKVQVAPCLEPAEDDFTTLTTGRGAKDGVLAQWALPTELDSCARTGTDSFSPPGTYTIRTLAYPVDGAGEPVEVANPTWVGGSDLDPNHALPESAPLYGQDRRVVTVRPNADADRPGSPHYLGASGEASPTLYDLEGRGELDVIVPTGDGKVLALRPNGTNVPGWPVEVDDYATAGTAVHTQPVNGQQPRPQVVASAAVGDLDGDGQPEVVAPAIGGGIYAWHRDGTRVAGFPVEVPPPPLHQAPADPFADSDANNDYCVTSHPAVADQNLSGYGSIAAPVLADIDTPADGTLEIVQAAENMCVYIVGSNGIVRSFFRPKTTPGTPTKIAATPAVGDFDDDGDQDIVVGTEEVTGSLGNTASRLYAYDARTATVLDGWPQNMPSISASGVPTVATGVISSPVLYRPDGSEDGPMETITGAFLQGDVHPVKSFDASGGAQTTLDTQTGGGGNATDLPFHWGITQTAVGKLGGSNDLSITTGGFGTFLAFDTAAIPGKKTQFQHMVGAWKAARRLPRADLPAPDRGLAVPVRAGDRRRQGRRRAAVDRRVRRRGRARVRSRRCPGRREHVDVTVALRRLQEPAGFPVHTGFGYITSTPAVGQLSRGGKVTVATVTRDGWLFLTETGGDAAANDQWWRFHHDERNTGQYGLDTRPPATVDDLAAKPRGEGGVATLTWTGVGDDWWVGKPARAEMRWSTSPITDAGFASATPVAGVAGDAQSAEVSGLPTGRPLYFALRFADEAGNRGLIARASTTLPAQGAAPDTLPSCAGFRLKSLRARPVRRGRALRLAFKRTGTRRVKLEIFRESRGKRIVRTKRVARYRGRRTGVTFRRKLAGGSYFLRGTLGSESLRSAFSVRRGRFLKRRPFALRDGCGALRRFKLLRSVFGGTKRTPLSVAVRLTRPGTVRLELRRGGRRLRTLLSETRGTGLRRVRVRPRGLRTGDYSLRITVEIGTVRLTRTVYARRL